MQRIFVYSICLMLLIFLTSCEKEKESIATPSPKTAVVKKQAPKCPKHKNCAEPEKQLDEVAKKTIAGPIHPYRKLFEQAKPATPYMEKAAPENKLRAAIIQAAEGKLPSLAGRIDLISILGRMESIDEHKGKTERVLAMLDDNRWYLAEVVEVGQEELKVKFYDESKKSIHRTLLRPVLRPRPEHVTVGDEYLIDRNDNGIFHLARVVFKKGHRLNVIYMEDGYKESIMYKKSVLFSPRPRSASRAEFSGQPVLALWDDGYFYRAVTDKVEDGIVSLHFEDGQKAELPIDRTRLRSVPAPHFLQKGALMMGNRGGKGAYFAGWLEEHQGKQVTLRYLSDNHTETLDVEELANF